MYKEGMVLRISSIITFHLSKLKSQVLHTVWCNISGRAAGEIWNWSLLGVKARLLVPGTFKTHFPRRTPNDDAHHEIVPKPLEARHVSIWRRFFFPMRSLYERFSNHSVLREEGIRFVELVTKLMERLLDYRSVISADDNIDNRMSCTVNVLVRAADHFKR